MRNSPGISRFSLLPCQRGSAGRSGSLRTKVNLLPEFLDPIRVIEIQGLDKQADGGTHVRSTAEVGRVAVTGTESKGKANKRIRIELAG